MSIVSSLDIIGYFYGISQVAARSRNDLIYTLDLLPMTYHHTSNNHCVFKTTQHWYSKTLFPKDYAKQTNSEEEE